MSEPSTTVALKDIRAQYDVAIIGAGPAGCAAAASFAERGASVLLVEANPKAARRFAGEWIHPEGVRILNALKLIEGLDAGVPGGGFAVVPNDGSDAIQLDYQHGATAFACEHETLVTHLRERVRALAHVDYVEGVRAQAADQVTVGLTASQTKRHVHAERIVIAAGRSSREETAASSQKHVPVSTMAGLLVHDTHLPFEGYGHVLVGGPGPILAYRIDSKRIRLCIDVPHAMRPRSNAAKWIWEAFAPTIPSCLHRGVQEALSRNQICWAANTFQPRKYATASGVALVGDAAGVFHPLTAMGITMSLLDVEALAQASSVKDYAAIRADQSFVPELLSNALYQAFVRTDKGAVAIRRSIFETWRTSPAHRNRTMRLLGGATVSRTEFVRAFSRVAVSAGRRVIVSEPWVLSHLVGWLRWPLASLHTRPDSVRARYSWWAAPDSWGSKDLLRALVTSEREQHANAN